MKNLFAITMMLFSFSFLHAEEDEFDTSIFDEGAEESILPTDITQDIIEWANNTAVILQKTIKNMNRLDVPAKKALLLDVIKECVPQAKKEEQKLLLMRFTLNRALKLAQAFEDYKDERDDQNRIDEIVLRSILLPSVDQAIFLYNEADVKFIQANHNKTTEEPMEHIAYAAYTKANIQNLLNISQLHTSYRGSFQILKLALVWVAKDLLRSHRTLRKQSPELGNSQNAHIIQDLQRLFASYENIKEEDITHFLNNELRDVLYGLLQDIEIEEGVQPFQFYPQVYSHNWSQNQEYLFDPEIAQEEERRIQEEEQSRIREEEQKRKEEERKREQQIIQEEAKAYERNIGYDTRTTGTNLCAYDTWQKKYTRRIDYSERGWSSQNQHYVWSTKSQPQQSQDSVENSSSFNLANALHIKQIKKPSPESVASGVSLGMGKMSIRNSNGENILNHKTFYRTQLTLATLPEGSGKGTFGSILDLEADFGGGDRTQRYQFSFFKGEIPSVTFLTDHLTIGPSWKIYERERGNAMSLDQTQALQLGLSSVFSNVAEDRWGDKKGFSLRLNGMWSGIGEVRYQEELPKLIANSKAERKVKVKSAIALSGELDIQGELPFPMVPVPFNIKLGAYDNTLRLESPEDVFPFGMDNKSGGNGFYSELDFKLCCGVPGNQHLVFRFEKDHNSLPRDLTSQFNPQGARLLSREQEAFLFYWKMRF